MRLVFVHGWSVTSTDTYGGLPAALVANTPTRMGLIVEHLYLGKYVSFSDEVTVDDIARGMQAAVADEILPKLARGERFACITHSTGGPVVRTWVDLHYRDRLARCPMSHLVMLAPANHGSALAQLGKSKLSRMKFFAEGVQPGTGVLDWLELGSRESWALNQAWLEYDLASAGMFAFVLTGQSIDRHFYDNLNSYTGEAGSDGVVRVAAANLNYGLIRLEQRGETFRLAGRSQTSATAMGVLPGLSHSGADMGIMASVPAQGSRTHPTVKALLQCLAVGSQASYRACRNALDRLTTRTQEDERIRRDKQLFLFSRKFETSRYFMLVFRVVDDRGNELHDYNIVFTAGPDYDANHLPPGFFVDRQRNSRCAGRLTYYLDYDVMAGWFARPQLEDRFGFEVSARPDAGYAFYPVGRYRGKFSTLRNYFAPNQTVMVEIVLQRTVMAGVFQLTQELTPASFKRQPAGEPI